VRNRGEHPENLNWQKILFCGIVSMLVRGLAIKERLFKWDEIHVDFVPFFIGAL